MKIYMAIILYVDGFISKGENPAKYFASKQSAKRWLTNNGTDNSINVIVDTKTMLVVYNN